MFFAEFEVLAVAFIKITVDWDFMPCEFATRYQHFEDLGDCIFNVISLVMVTESASEILVRQYQSTGRHITKY